MLNFVRENAFHDPGGLFITGMTNVLNQVSDHVHGSRLERAVLSREPSREIV